MKKIMICLMLVGGSLCAMEGLCNKEQSLLKRPKIDTLSGRQQDLAEPELRRKRLEESIAKQDNILYRKVNETYLDCWCLGTAIGGVGCSLLYFAGMVVFQHYS